MVAHMTLYLIAFASQFAKIVNVLSKKPFADKVDTKYYSNMFVIYLTTMYPRLTPSHQAPRLGCCPWRSLGS